MRTAAEIGLIRDTLYVGAHESVNKLVGVKAAEVANLGSKSEEEFKQAVAGLISDIKAVILSVRTEDMVGFPDTLNRFYYTPSAEGIASVQFRVGSKLKSPVKFSEAKEFPIDENLVTNVGSFYIDCMLAIFDREQAVANLKELNAKVADICSAQAIPFAVEFDCNPSDVPVLYIDDSRIVFNVSVEKAFDVASLALFASGDNYNDYVANHAEEGLAAALSAVQTPVQLIKAKKVDLVREMTDLSTKKRASKIIRMAYHRQAKYLGAVKSGVGYFDEKVKVNGEDVDVFALVSKAEDGSLSVVLSPFDTKSNFVVEFDVIAAVEEQLAVEKAKTSLEGVAVTAVEE